MALLVEAFVKWRMRKYQHAKTTAPTNTNVLIGAGFVVALKLAWCRARPGYWFLCSMMSINQMHQVVYTYGETICLRGSGVKYREGCLLLHLRDWKQTIVISKWRLMICEICPCAAHINVGSVRCSLHNAIVYLSPRECKTKYQGHAIN